MKRLCALVMVFMILASCLSAYADQMNKDVPVWTEETVRQYALDYANGKSMDRLWGYYDLQIRRYLPQEAFEVFLTDLNFMTGRFLALGSYRSFDEPDQRLKTHVVHLIMEKQDLDMYFTHKDKEDDWEIMAVEFVPAAKEELSSEAAVQTAFVEKEITLGASGQELHGILTIPAGASKEMPAPACVLVHDFGPWDLDHTNGGTKLFRDVAEQFASMGIAVLRYDKRTYAYPESKIDTVSDEVIQDALAAVELLKKTDEIDSDRVVVLGVGLGGMLAPRIASDSNGSVAGMIMIGATPDRLINVIYQRNKDSVAVLPKAEAEVVKNAVRNIGRMKEEKARELDLFGHNGYYYWESEQTDSVKLIKSMRLPMYIAHGEKDTEISSRDGFEAYRKQVGPDARFVKYMSFRGLNHLLMNDLSTNVQGKSEYNAEAHLDMQAGRSMALWILSLGQ